MAIQHRRGNEADLDKNKLLPGEFAFTLDTGKLYYCYGAGLVKSLATIEDLQFLLDISSEAYNALQQLISDLEADPSLSTTILSDIDTLKQSVNDLNLRISNIEIGGRNLARGTSKHFILEGDNTSEQTVYCLYPIDGTILSNKEVAISFKWRIISETGTGKFNLQTTNPQWLHFPSSGIDVSSLEGTHTQIVKFGSNMEFTGIGIRADYLVGTLEIYDVKFEFGNKPTDWTPAPEDVQAEINKKANNDDFNTHLAKTVYQPGGVHGLEIEEGTWAPEISARPNESSGNHTYTHQIGKYKRIGNMVIATFQVRLSQKDTAMSGAAHIRGLPFATNASFAVHISHYLDLTGLDGYGISGRLYEDSTYIQVGVEFKDRLSSISTDAITDTTEFIGEVIYFIDL